MRKQRPPPDKPVVELGGFRPPPKAEPAPEQPPRDLKTEAPIALKDVPQPAMTPQPSQNLPAPEPTAVATPPEPPGPPPVHLPAPELKPVVNDAAPDEPAPRAPEPGPERPAAPEGSIQREFNWEERLIQLEKRGSRLLQYKIDNVVTVELGKFNDQGFYRLSVPGIDPVDQTFFNVILRQAQIAAVNDKAPLSSVIKKIIAENKLVVRNAPVLAYHIMARLSPWGKLYPMLTDQHVKEVLCRDGTVSVIIKDYPGLGWFETTMELNNSEQAVISRRFLANTKGYEAITEEGHYASFSVSTSGPSLIYVKKANPGLIPITVLINRGVLSVSMATYIWMASSFGGLIAVVGPPKSAKTTMINAAASLIPFNKTMAVIETAVEHQYPNRKYSKYTPIGKEGGTDGVFLMAPDSIVVDPLEKTTVDLEKMAAYVRTGRVVFAGVEAPEVEVAAETLKSYGFPEAAITSIIYTGLVDNTWKVLGIYEAPFRSPILKWSNDGVSDKPTKDLAEQSTMLQRLATKKGWSLDTLVSSFDARNKFLNGLVISQAFSPEEFSRSLMVGRQLIY